jgi:hypothetical protein
VACANAFRGSTFAVPANGWRNELLRRAHAAAGDAVWLASGRADW